MKLFSPYFAAILLSFTTTVVALGHESQKDTEGLGSLIKSSSSRNASLRSRKGKDTDPVLSNLSSHQVSEIHRAVQTSDQANWEPIGTSPQGNGGKSFAMSADGTIVAVGYGDNAISNYAGIVGVFSNVNGVWTSLGGPLVGGGSQVRHGTGVALSRDGSIVACGAPRGAYGHGYIRVFQYDGTDWSLLGNQINGDTGAENFGSAVALSADGTTVLGGSPRNDGSYDSDVLRVFELSNGIWVPKGSPIFSDSSDQFGFAVAMSDDGNTIAGGARWHASKGQKTGRVRAYEYINGDWSQIGDNIDGEKMNDQFGWSVALSADGKFLAAGGPTNDGDNSGDTLNGHIRVFENIGNQWVQVGADIDGRSHTLGHSYGGQLGTAVALSADGSVVVGGSEYDDEAFGDSGAITVYKYVDGSWTQVGEPMFGTSLHYLLGRGVDISHDGQIVGGIGAKGSRIFELPAPSDAPSDSPSDVPSDAPSDSPSDVPSDA
eukprot:CAMPEP_0178964312 /NCGR_PEP_ID=MMETSP0789-20121207/15597_1 /TAXON_ID=3005 /ORGANISM="Rhizosolenia setigera, Strain CCMP 1694" /LENGTH=488 /DNA_ID=CAMNT_0020649053 /DNA_START=40 /DNA_END=1502 /DNA_ORIENTATION=+